MPFSAVTIETNGSFAGTSINPAYGVFVWNNSLVCCNFENDNTVGIYQSVNAGANWSKIGGAGGPSGMASMAAFLDNNRLVVAYNTSSFVLSAIHLVSFDLNALTWTNISVSANTCLIISAVYYSSVTGNYTIVSNYGTAPVTPQSGSGAGFAVYVGGSWIYADLGHGITLLAGWDDTQTAVSPFGAGSCMDSTGVVHCFLQTLSTITTPGAQWNNLYFYQQILANATLGNFHMFSGQQPSSGVQDLVLVSPSSMNRPAIVGTQIIVGIVRSNPSCTNTWYPSVYIGTGLVTPTWAALPATGIDASANCAQQNVPQTAPAITTDGTNILAAWEYKFNSGQWGIRISQTLATTPTTGWTASTAIGPQAALIQYPIFYAFGGQALLSGNSTNPTWYGNFVPITPPVVNPKIGLITTTGPGGASLPIILPNPAYRC